MSVLYDTDPGRLEVYRPRADGLMGRSFCGSLLLHLLFGALLLTVRLPAPKPPPPRRYRITEVTLLPPRPRPAEESPETPKELRPRDLSLFLNDLAPLQSHRRRGRRHSRRRSVQPILPSADTVAREVKPEAPEPGDLRRSHMGPQLAQGLPNMLERPMVDRQPVEPAPAQAPAAPSSPPAHRATERPKRAAVPAARERHRALAPRPTVIAPRRVEAGDHQEPAPAPKMVVVARADRARPLADFLPKTRETAGASSPDMPPLPSAATPTLSPERPVELPAERAGSGKRMAPLPGDLFGSGSAAGPGPSHREAALPEGRPGAAQLPGPRRPRLSHGRVGQAPSPGGGETAGINPVAAPGGARLNEDERPDALRRGSPSDFGDLGGKGTPVASLPSSGADAPGTGSGAASRGGGAGGGFGTESPRAFGGGDRPGRPSSQSHTRTPSAGDGAGALGAGTDSGIAIPGAGTAGGAAGSPAAGNDSAGDRPGRGAHGKRLARAELPAEGDGVGGPGSGSGAGPGAGPEIASGPRSFGGGKRRVTTGTGEGTGTGSHKGKGHSSGSDSGDETGVSLPSGGGDDDDPGRDAGSGDSDSGFHKGRTRPAGVYVSTTGKFTLPGAIYNGDYRYNSQALRIIMDELNSRTKVKVQLGGKYESIAPGSFQRAPVVVFTGHKAFELTDDQRKVLKEYVDSGGMIWADFSHAAFDDSFRSEMEKIFGRAPSPLPMGHQIYRSFYVLHQVPPGDLGDANPFEGISVGDRLGVVITPNRYFSAVGRSLNTSEEVQEGAIQAVVNIYMYAAGNYRAVKDAGD